MASPSSPQAMRIARRFIGPPNSANGGYVSGRLAAHVGEPAEVRLLAPPPVERELHVDAGRLLDGHTVVAQAQLTEMDLELPSAVSFEEAIRASERYVARHQHPYPDCFVCGPRRQPGDGLRLFAGPLGPGAPVAAPFVPDASLATDAGVVRREMLWAALDCPGYFGAMKRVEAALLGSIAAEVLRDVRVGERLTVLGWSRGEQGRKRFAGTALFDEDGALVGRSSQTWIVVSQPVASV